MLSINLIKESVFKKEDYSYRRKLADLEKFLKERFDLDIGDYIKQYKWFFDKPILVCSIPGNKTLLIDIAEMRDFDTNEITSEFIKNKKYFVLSRQRVGIVYFQEIVYGGYHVWEKESGREIIISKKELESF